ncbi:MAG: hypothetical protein J6D52_01360 [Clostridia bacterium]|nr:hypothetical protein [Clostridia bacterium]
MKSKKEKKDYIRALIISAAKEYKKSFAGKSFIYVYGENCFEVEFQTKQFKHLTGVKSNVSADDFYKYANKEILTNNQFGFDSRYPFDTAKKKLKCFPSLSQLTTDTVCVVKDFKTLTITYKIGITNLNFTLGLIEKEDNSNIFIPQTLRINDKAIENSLDAEFVDFIFVKDGAANKYTDISYADKTNPFPNNLIPRLSKKLKQKLFDEGYILNSYELNEELIDILENAYTESKQTETPNVEKELIKHKE